MEEQFCRSVDTKSLDSLDQFFPLFVQIYSKGLSISGRWRVSLSLSLSFNNNNNNFKMESREKRELK